MISGSDKQTPGPPGAPKRIKDMEFNEMVNRVAARSLKAQGEKPQNDQGQQALQQQQALPQSGPGKNMLKGALDKLNDAFASGDDDAFDAALENVIKAKGNKRPA